MVLFFFSHSLILTKQFVQQEAGEVRAPAGRGRHGADAKAGLEVRLHLRQLPPSEAHQVRGGAEEEGGGGVDVSHAELLLHKRN